MEMSQSNSLYVFSKYLLFFQKQVQEGTIGPVWGLAPVGGGGYKERVKEGEYCGNIM
jgi:hypothetical protein